MVKAILKYIGKEKDYYKFLNAEKGQYIDLKIFKDKEFKDKIVKDSFGTATYNKDWLNDWEELEYKEKPKKPVVVDERTTSIIAQSTLKESVRLCIAQGRGSLKNVKIIHKELYNYMIKEEYK